ncbi:MAG: hypoxanthine phosphoribosyltransferase [Proteobacteria bacterium]|nr:hypoxanthine phosphoribosyltransferase [Pseudomonadota bacterium]
MYKVFISEDKLKERIAELGKEISDQYKGEQVVIVVLLRGSFMFAADLVRAIDGDLVVDFMVVSSYQGMETSGEVRIYKDLAENIHDRHVLIVEDIVDTGLTLTKILEVLKSRNPKSLETCSLLSKPSRRIKEVAIKYVGFTIEDKFVIGYGLDLDQKYRQLPYIAEMTE